MRSFAAILTIILFSLPSYAQLVVPYYSLTCDSDFPSEQHVIDRVFTGNTPAFRVYFYTSNGTPANLSGTWSMTFAYGYTQQDTNGMVRIPGTWTNSNTCLFTSTNAFAGARDWYFSVYGVNTISGVKTFARGKMIEEFDPATANSANLNLRKTFNWDEISNTGTPPWSIPGLWTTNLSGHVILPSGTLNLTNVETKVAEPTDATHAASKGYVDTADALLYPRNNPSNWVDQSVTNGLYPASNPSNWVQSSVTNGLAPMTWVTDNFLTEAIAETLYESLGATAAYSNWADGYFYPRNNPSNWVTVSVTNGLWGYQSGTNWVYITFYPRNNPSNWVTAAVTNGLYPESNPSNWVTAAVTNGLWAYAGGTNWVFLNYYPRNNPSNWVTASVTANVPTRAEVSNSITYETLSANSDVGVGSSQVAQGSHGHSSYIWSLAYSQGTTNGVSESSTIGTVYFKTNWATENPDSIQYMSTRTASWDQAWTLIDSYAESITNIFGWTNNWNQAWTWVSTFAPGYTNLTGWTSGWQTASSYVAARSNAWDSMVANGATNAGMGLTNIYVQSNGVWILMPAVGGGGGDVYLANNNVFTGPYQTMPTVETHRVTGGANMSHIDLSSQFNFYVSDDGFSGGDFWFYGRGLPYYTVPTLRIQRGDPGKGWFYGDLDVAGNLDLHGTLNGIAISAMATNAGPSGGSLYAMSNSVWTAFTPGSGSAVTAHAPSHAGTGSDPITSLGAVTYSGTQDLAGNNVTNGATGSFTNLNMLGNIRLNSGYLSGDGGNEGVSVDASGNVTLVASDPTYRLIMSSTAGLYHNLSSSGGSSWNIFRSGGTYSSPSVASNGYSGNWYFRTHDGYSYGVSGSMSMSTSTDCTSNTRPTYIQFSVAPATGGGVSTAIRIDPDRAIRFYNMTTAPTTASGYGIIAASNNEVYVWDGSGNRTLLSAENEQGEMIRKTDKPYGGFTETVNLSQLGRMMEDVAAGKPVMQYAGKIYSSNAIPALDWRANEARAEAESVAAINQWICLPVTNKDTACPDRHYPRPIPVWAATAQKQFDGKHK